MCWGQITRYMLYGHPSHAMGILNKWVYTTNGPMSIPFCGNKIKVLTKNRDYDNPQDIYWVVQSHIIKIINQQGFWRISSNISWLYIPLNLLVLLIPLNHHGWPCFDNCRITSYIHLSFIMYSYLWTYILMLKTPVKWRTNHQPTGV